MAKHRHSIWILLVALSLYLYFIWFLQFLEVGCGVAASSSSRQQAWPGPGQAAVGCGRSWRLEVTVGQCAVCTHHMGHGHGLVLSKQHFAGEWAGCTLRASSTCPDEGMATWDIGKGDDQVSER